MPAEPTSPKTVKPQVTFKWDDASSWPVLQTLAADRGYSSVNLFARYLCEQAVVSNRDGQGKTAPATMPSGVQDRLEAIATALDALRTDFQKLGEPDEETAASLGKIKKSVRSLLDTVKAEFLQLRGDTAQQFDRAAEELHSLRCNLADAFTLLLVKVDPKVKVEDAKEWVSSHFFNSGG